MDKDPARAAATAHIRDTTNDPPDVVILDQYTIETPRTWIFFYQSRQRAEERNPDHALMGNLPLLVDKASGKVRDVGGRGPIEERIAQVEQ